MQSKYVKFYRKEKTFNKNKNCNKVENIIITERQTSLK